MGGCAQQQTSQLPAGLPSPNGDIDLLASSIDADAGSLSESLSHVPMSPKNTETLLQIQSDLDISSPPATGSGAATQPTEKSLRAFGLGRAAWLSGDDAEAQAFLEEARVEDPYSPAVLELLAQVYADEGRDDAAYECLIVSEKITPYSLQTNLMLGQFAYHKHDWPSAILYLLRAQNSPELHTDLPLGPLIDFYLAISLQNAGYHRAAADRFIDCLELFSIPRPSYRLNRQVLAMMDHKNLLELLAGENAYLAGDYATALELYRQAKMGGLIVSSVQVRITMLEALQQDFGAAEQDAVQFACSDSVSPQAAALINWVWEQAGRSFWLRDDLAEMGQNDPLALFVLGMLEKQLGDWPDSYANLYRYLEERPDDVRALVPLVAMARDQQQIPQAYSLMAWLGSQGKISSEIIGVDFLMMVGQNPSSDLITQLSSFQRAQSGQLKNGILQCWQFYLLGMVAGQGDQPELAVEFLYKAVDADPDFWPAAQLLVRHLVDLNQFRAAENVVRDQINRPASAPDALAELVRVYIAEDRLELAVQTAELGIRRYPDDSDCYLLAADIYDVRRDNDRESYALDRLVSRFPDFQEGYQRLLDFAADTQNDQLQEAVGSRYIAQFPNDSLSGILSARQMAQQGDYDGAARVLQRALMSHPGDESLYLAMAELQSAQGNQTAALAILQYAVKIDVNSVDLYVALTQALVGLNRSSEAEAVFSAAAMQHLESQRWQTAYVALLDNWGRQAEIKSWFDTLMAQEPSQRWVQLLYEQYLEQTNQWAGARNVLQRLTAGPYQDLSDLYALAQVDRMLGDSAGEMAVYQRILELSPYDADANNNLGYEWTLQGVHLPEALRMIGIAVENYPNESAYRDSLGLVLFRLGHLNQALDELQTAVNLPGGQNPEGLEHLGDVLDALGQKTEAIESWKQGLQLLATQTQLTPDDLQTQKDLQDRIKKAAPWIKLNELTPDNAN
jgi:Flp pilus assembly protein TadD